MKTTEITDLEELKELARCGNWTLIESKLLHEHACDELVAWLLGDGLYDIEQDIRDLGATMLNFKTRKLTPDELEKLEGIMLAESDRVVQFRLALALFERGHTPEPVLEMMKRAKQDPDVGLRARQATPQPHF